MNNQKGIGCASWHIIWVEILIVIVVLSRTGQNVLFMPVFYPYLIRQLADIIHLW